MNTYGLETTEGSITYYNGLSGTEKESVADANRYNGSIGMNASTTGNLYGVYDKNTAGSQLPSNSSKYVTIYPIDTTVEGDDGSIHFHYEQWKDVYGDAIYEKSNGNGNISNKSWFDDYTDEDIVGDDGPFCTQGGYFTGGEGVGVFAFSA